LIFKNNEKTQITPPGTNASICIIKEKVHSAIFRCKSIISTYQYKSKTNKTKTKQQKQQKIKVCFCPQKRMSPPVPQTAVKGKKSI
jgi:hypothetical protein